MAKARSPAGALNRLLQEATCPIYVLDEARQIVFANAALAQWLGVDESHLLGARCDYHSAAGESAEQALAATLCPPPEAFAENCVRFLLHRPAGTQAAESRFADCTLLSDAGGGAGAVFVKMADATCAEERARSAETWNPPESQILHDKLAAFRRQAGTRYSFDRLVGASPKMRRVRAQAELAAQSQSGVLIVGPRGSGREHLARAIHVASRDAGGTLVPLACPLLDAETLQSTVRKLKHRPTAKDAERASVLLLLEVDQLPADAQDELAGFLNLPEFRLHTLATARRSLVDLASGAGFRHDLACLLETLTIELPSLAERREDVPLLAQMLLEEHNAEGGAQLSGFTPEALDELVAYPWPGNVDELVEFVAESCGKAVGPLVGTPDLPPRIRLAAEAAAFPPPADEQIVLDDFLAEIERELIERALVRAKQNRTKAASLLGMTRARLHRRLIQLGLAEAGSTAEEPIAFEEVEFIPEDE